jgi:drug/metabolite transporter (DMT)-like permease
MNDHSTALPSIRQDLALKGALYKGLSCLCFAAIYGCVRYFTLTAKEMGLPPLPAPELAFFETLFGFLFILPWLLPSGIPLLKKTNTLLYVARACVVSFGVILWFMALSKMPIVQVVAFKYIAPLFTILSAKFFLREKCGLARAIAISASLLGAALITGQELLEGGMSWLDAGLLGILPLGAAACHALSAVFGKTQAKSDSPQTITFYLLLFTLPLLGFASTFEWVTPLLWQWPWLILMGAILACAYMSLSQAFVAADITYLVPVSFVRLIAGALIGMVFLNEWPTVWTWMGSFCILGATIALCQYEARQTQR